MIQSNLDQVTIDQPDLQPLIEEIVLTVLKSIKDQISVKQWQLDAAAQDQGVVKAQVKAD